MEKPSPRGTLETSLQEDTQHEPDRFNNRRGAAGGSAFELWVVVAVWFGAEARLTRTTLQRWSLQLETMAPATQMKYLYFIKRFLESCGHKPANRISRSDVQCYMNTLLGRSSQEIAFVAIKSFLEEAGRAISKKKIRFKSKKERRPIEQITPETFEQLLNGTRNQRDRVFLLILKDTGGRCSAICNAKIEDFKDNHIILQGDVSKNGITSVAPLSLRTINALKQYLDERKPKIYIFEKKSGEPLNRTRAWEIVKRARIRAGISQKIYPHLFRHQKALECRKAGLQPDVVMNLMGWSDTSQYDKRYGKRTATETLEDARKILDKPKSETHDLTTKTIEKLASMLAEGKIDIQTYQATLVALRKDQKNPVDAGNPYGYS
jgi:integrase/recombinase XerD